MLKPLCPYLMKAFPETQVMQGIIESDTVAIPEMQAALAVRYQTPLTGKCISRKTVICRSPVR